MEAVYRLYVEWRAKILTDKDPKDEKEFCDRYKITMSDILSFIERPQFEDDVLDASLRWAKKSTPKLIHQVYKQVEKSNSVSDLEKFMALIHGISKKENDKGQVNNIVFTLSDDQFNKIAAREYARTTKGRILDIGGEEQPA